MGKSAGSNVALLMKKRYNQVIEIKDSFSYSIQIKSFFELTIVLS